MKKTTAVSIDPDVAETMRLYGVKLDRSFSYMVEKACRKFLSDRKIKIKPKKSTKNPSLNVRKK